MLRYSLKTLNIQKIYDFLAKLEKVEFKEHKNLNKANITSESQFYMGFQMSIITPGFPEMRVHWIRREQNAAFPN
jgi:hypothetical protein